MTLRTALKNCVVLCIFSCLTIRSKTERRRNFIGDQIDDCKDLSGLFYLLPFQKGFLVNWDTQRQLWDYVFGQNVLNIQPSSHHLVFTEPVFNFLSIQDTLNEIVFEEYKFKSFLRTPSPTLSSLNYEHSHKDALCTLVVDSGYSFTHIVPYYKGRMITSAVVRIDVGGKLLTNHLKEITSYRQLHVLDETYVMNQVKEDSCYVSQDFYAELEIARRKNPNNTLLKQYVLPNYSDRRRGFLRDLGSNKSSSNREVDEQCLRLSNERIAIPEILFHPSDIGIEQMGIPEAIGYSISHTPQEMHPHLYSNIIVTGGNTMFPGFGPRLTADVRKQCPSDFDVNVFLPPDPVGFAWQGGGLAADDEKSWEHLQPVTLAEYKEHGHWVCNKRFNEDSVWSI